ncbi:VWA domain-containing protein, partial [Candidatus Omnitrophota bacterium]
MGGSIKTFLYSKMVYLRCAALVIMIIALARPQSPIADSIKRAKGINIILTVDVSTSMLAEDFGSSEKKLSRFDALKDILPHFIEQRKNDRIGLVAFGARPYTVSPLTLNHDWLISNLDRIYAGMLEDSTAIGSALATSLNRIKKIKSKSKVIILLTDGRNNAGKITPMAA